MWTYSHPSCMDFRMKTTLNIDDTVVAELKREATRQGRTMSELVETALRSLFQRQRISTELSPLPTFMSGGSFVDIGDQDALYQAMEGR
jgi:Arc/MetJ family transcription regulator